MVTECCSESRMRSRTSRGVPEWSGGKDLYMGSPVSVTGKVSGAIANVPGPPGGSRGSTRWGHRPQRAAWAKCGKGPAPRWAGALPTRGPRRKEGGKGENPWLIRPPNACRGLRNPFRTRWSSPGTPGTIPDSKTLRPIYRSSPPDNSGAIVMSGISSGTPNNLR